MLSAWDVGTGASAAAGRKRPDVEQGKEQSCAGPGRGCHELPLSEWGEQLDSCPRFRRAAAAAMGETHPLLCAIISQGQAVFPEPQHPRCGLTRLPGVTACPTHIPQPRGAPHPHPSLVGHSLTLQPHTVQGHRDCPAVTHTHLSLCPSFLRSHGITAVISFCELLTSSLTPPAPSSLSLPR